MMTETTYIKKVVVSVLEVAQQWGAKKVSEVQLTLNRAIADTFTETTLQENFKVLTFDTPAQNARLVINTEAPQYKCLDCARQFKTLGRQQTIICPECDGIVVEDGLINPEIFTVKAVSFF